MIRQPIPDIQGGPKLPLTFGHPVVVNDRIMDLKDPSPLQFYDRIRERRHISKEGKNDRLASISIRSS